MTSDLITLSRADLEAALRAGQAALARSEERLAFVFDASGSLGWWDWDIPGDRIFASPFFAEMYGIDPQRAASGAPLSDFVAGIHPEDRAVVGERIAAAVAGGDDFAADYRLRHADGRTTWVHARGRCYLDAAGRPLRFPGVSIDITARKAEDRRKQALIELGDALRDLHDIGAIVYAAAAIAAWAVDAKRAGFGLVNAEDELVDIRPEWRAEGVSSIAGEHRFRDYGSFIDELKAGRPVLIGDVTTHPSTAANAAALLAIGIRVLVNVPVIEQGRLAIVLFVHDDRPRDLPPAEIDFLQSVVDRTQAAIGRVRAEEQQKLLNRELSHRLKNTLAMVQAIATQTMRNARSIEDARTALVSRLQNLGHAHEVLLSGTRTESADLRALVEAALAVHDDAEKRFRINGPSLRIGPAAALSLSLMLHELATNAAKYGALSVPGGTVAIDWRVDGGDEPVFAFGWQERNGPPVAPPAGRGFGSRLIERGLAGSVGGTVSLDFAPAGVSCRFAAPARSLIDPA